MPNLPYVANPGTLRTMLEKMRDAILPERFTGDFIETKLQMKGGTARSTAPFIKKMNFVQLDGTPTDLYKEYRNKAKSGQAIAKGMKIVYKDIFEQNEFAYELEDKRLLGLIVQLTGGDEQASATKYTLQCFKILREMATFEEDDSAATELIDTQYKPVNPQEELLRQIMNTSAAGKTEESINLSYTINLNLPATTNIEVFNAIFKSLKEHLINQ